MPEIYEVVNYIILGISIPIIIGGYIWIGTELFKSVRNKNKSDLEKSLKNNDKEKLD